jgi:ketosteroid isomerase-like protein
MSTKLSPPIAAYIQAANAHTTDALLDTLTADAVVMDEGHTYRGHDEIREWSHRTNQEYQATLDVMEVTQTHEETIVTALVAGTFEGSPLPLRFHFTLSGDKIAALTIGG